MQKRPHSLTKAEEVKPQKTFTHIIVLVVIVLAGLAFAAKDIDLHHILAILANMRPLYLLGACACFFIYIYCEARAYRLLLRSYGYRIRTRKTYLYALSDYFFSSISPGGSGGQFGQFYMMQRDGISPAACLSSLLSFNMLYHFIFCVLAVISWSSGVMKEVAHHGAIGLIIAYGVGAQLIFTLGMGGMLFSRRLIPCILKKVQNIMKNFKLTARFTPDEETVERFLEDYKSYGQHIKEHPVLLLQASVFIFFQTAFLYAIPWFVCLALGIHIPLIYMLIFQSVCVVATESIPLPGGAGASEIFFASTYATLMPETQAFSLMFMTRALSLYLGLIVGGLAISLTPKAHIISTKFHERSKRQPSCLK